MKKHIYESAGVGIAPYKFVGIWQYPGQAMQEANPEVYNRAMKEAPQTKNHICGCALCGTYIVNNYLVKDGNSDLWAIGSECISKINGMKEVAAEAKVAKKKIEKAEKRKKAEAKEFKDTELAKELLADDRIRARLSEQPHPSEHFASQGQTRLDWAEWMMERHYGSNVYNFISSIS